MQLGGSGDAAPPGGTLETCQGGEPTPPPVHTYLQGDPSLSVEYALPVLGSSSVEDPGHSQMGCLSSLLANGKDSSEFPLDSPTPAGHLPTGLPAAGNKDHRLRSQWVVLALPSTLPFKQFFLTSRVEGASAVRCPPHTCFLA